MAHGDEAIQALREALRHSPDNLPLRLHLADSLAGFGRFEEAEKEYRAALSSAPDDVRVKLGLAGAFYQQGKNSAALVIVEELIKSPNPPARVHLMYARLLLRAGDVERAVRQYKRAIDADPSAADPDLAARLGIRTGGADAPAHKDDDDRPVVDGKVRASWEGSDDGPEVEVERPR